MLPFFVLPFCGKHSNQTSKKRTRRSFITTNRSPKGFELFQIKPDRKNDLSTLPNLHPVNLQPIDKSKLIDYIPEARFDDTEQILSTIEEWGIVMIKDYDLGPLDQLEAEAREMLEKKGDDSYKAGVAVRLTSANQLDGASKIKSIFQSDWLRNITDRYEGKPNRFFDGMYITHEFRNDQGLPRNGFLHFDRFRTFKAFLYLTDSDKASGAFTCVPGSHKFGSMLREKVWKKTKKYSELPNRIFMDYPEFELTKEDLVSVSGPKGSFFLFDTDLFHMGGVLENGRERLIMRSHSVGPDQLHEKSNIGRLRSKVRNALFGK